MHAGVPHIRTTESYITTSTIADTSTAPETVLHDLISVLTHIETAAIWLLLQLPVPDHMLPGYNKYVTNIATLDELVYGIIRRRRERGTSRHAGNCLLRTEGSSRWSHPLAAGVVQSALVTIFPGCILLGDVTEPECVLDKRRIRRTRAPCCRLCKCSEEGQLLQ